MELVLLVSLGFSSSWGFGMAMTFVSWPAWRVSQSHFLLFAAASHVLGGLMIRGWARDKHTVLWSEWLVWENFRP
ncbi:hypothetical protein QBC47DRAFT_389250 [Echria macrotheca]|uniref:Uncharacterized protein n=1 Tax=Echria macrotheca TaxID=438768 RepID=A0AAJ0B754_9PEZI|nr:hypothetical protein QBC47DRAFT_389250 [Echria macrotheca]